MIGRIGLRAKLIASAILATVGFFAFVLLRGSADSKSKLEYERRKVEAKIKLKELDKASAHNQAELSELAQQSAEIRERIRAIESKPSNPNPTIGEVNDFFKNRGF